MNTKLKEMMNEVDNGEELFNTDESFVEPIVLVDPTEQGEEKNLDADTKYVRRKIYHLIQKSEVLLDCAFETARGDKSARSFEVCSALLKSYLDTLSEFQKTSKDTFATKQKINADKQEDGSLDPTAKSDKLRGSSVDILALAEINASKDTDGIF